MERGGHLLALLVYNPADVARHEWALRPWADRPMDCVIRIEPELVTGYRLVPVEAVAGWSPTAHGALGVTRR